MPRSASPFLASFTQVFPSKFHTEQRAVSPIEPSKSIDELIREKQRYRRAEKEAQQRTEALEKPAQYLYYLEVSETEQALAISAQEVVSDNLNEGAYDLLGAQQAEALTKPADNLIDNPAEQAPQRAQLRKPVKPQKPIYIALQASQSNTADPVFPYEDDEADCNFERAPGDMELQFNLNDVYELIPFNSGRSAQETEEQPYAKSEIYYFYDPKLSSFSPKPSEHPLEVLQEEVNSLREQLRLEREEKKKLYFQLAKHKQLQSTQKSECLRQVQLLKELLQ